jgi:hypothetical protein
MLGRKFTASASFVCLRCRFQLAGTTKRLPFPAIAISPVRSPRRYIGTHATPAAPEKPNGQDDADTNTEPSREAEEHDINSNEGHNEGHNEGFAAYRPPPPPNRRYVSRGHFLSPGQEGLPIDILGKPGSAIIMREKKFKRKRESPQSNPDDALNAPVDMARLLPTEGAETVFEDVLLNIHELKPKDTHLVTENEFMTLKDTLLGGFTTTQLMNYMKEYREPGRLAQEDKPVSENPPWLQELRPWVPAVENAVQDVGPQLDGYITSDMTPKERLAIRVMRECWDLSYQEILDRHGYLSLKLRDVEFSLLTSRLSIPPSVAGPS